MRRIIIIIAVFLLVADYAYGQYSGEGAFGAIRNFLKRINTDILPSADDTYDVGSDTKQWQDIYISGALYQDGVEFSAGAGDVTGPASSVDNEIVRFNGTTGKIIQAYTSGGPTVGDTGNVQINSTLTTGINAAGYDVKFYGTTTGNYLLWDASGDRLTFKDADDSGSIYFDNTRNDLIFTNDGIFEDINPGLYIRCTDTGRYFGWHYHYNEAYPLAFYTLNSNGNIEGLPLIAADNVGTRFYFPKGIGTLNNEDFIRINDGIAKIIPTNHILQGSLGTGDYDTDPDVWIMDLDVEVYPSGIVITKWYVDCNEADPTTELDANLKYCDAVANGAFPGANATLIDVLDTTTGNSSETNMASSDLGSGVIPTGKTLYIVIDADPVSDTTIFRPKIHYYIPQ